MSVTASFVANCTVIETATLGAESQTLTHDDFNTSKKLDASSTPPGKTVYNQTLTGTGAAVNYDLTALVRTGLTTLDATDDKLQVLKVNNLSTTNDVDVEDGAANPYQINDGDKIHLEPGCTVQRFFNDKLADVAAGAKNIKITATNGETFELLMVFG